VFVYSFMIILADFFAFKTIHYTVAECFDAKTVLNTVLSKKMREKPAYSRLRPKDCE
jgi:hypothetical protein